MKLINIKDYKSANLSKLIYQHLGKYNIRLNGYVYLDNKNNNKLVGYSFYKIKGDTIILDWIWAKPGHGTPFLKKMESIWKNKYKTILLNLSIDPTESKRKVIRRINFYIKNNYRVKNIKYRQKFGPLLKMYKNL